MHRLLPLVIAAGFAGCSETAVNNNDPDVGSARYALGGAYVTITYNPDTDVYLVTPVDDEAQRFEGNPTYDREGFDLASGVGLVATQMRGDSQVALFADLRDDPEVIINFYRSGDSNVPTTGGATYTGDYYAVVFVNNSFEGEITGDATLTASFGGDPEISGSITNRQLFTLASPFVATDNPADLTLVLNPLTDDGRVALDGADPPTVTGDDSTMFGETFQIMNGRYGGTVAGPDGAHFIGGVEIEYLQITGDLNEAMEYGAIAASQ